MPVPGPHSSSWVGCPGGAVNIGKSHYLVSRAGTGDSLYCFVNSEHFGLYSCVEESALSANELFVGKGSGNTPRGHNTSPSDTSDTRHRNTRACSSLVPASVCEGLGTSTPTPGKMTQAIWDCSRFLDYLPSPRSNLADCHIRWEVGAPGVGVATPPSSQLLVYLAARSSRFSSSVSTDNRFRRSCDYRYHW